MDTLTELETLSASGSPKNTAQVCVGWQSPVSGGWGLMDKNRLKNKEMMKSKEMAKNKELEENKETENKEMENKEMENKETGSKELSVGRG